MSLEDKQAEFKKCCARIIALASTAESFPCSGLAKGSIDEIVAQCRKAFVISDHRMGFGPTFMDMPKANLFRFQEAVQLEYYNCHVAQVRGRKSPFMPVPKND